MDSTRNDQIRATLTAIPRIAAKPGEWVAAAPSRLLNGLLAAGWLGFLWTIGLFSAATSDEPAAALTFVDQFALMMFLATLGGILAVVSFAIANSSATAPVSAICGLSVIVIGATCGFVGHPASAWGPNAALAAILVAASVFVMGRRAGQ